MVHFTSFLSLSPQDARTQVPSTTSISCFARNNIFISKCHIGKVLLSFNFWTQAMSSLSIFIAIITYAQVLNYGPSSIDQVKMVFEVPAVLKTGEDNHHFVRLYQPQTSLNLHSFSCSAEGGEFYTESIKGTGMQPTGVPLSTTFPESSQNVSNDQPLREKRSTDQGYVYSPAYFPSNKTLFVNCSNSEEGCMVITCYAGPLKVSQTGGVIVFPMKVIASNLDHVFEDKDVILFASSGKVEILGMKHSIQPRVHKPDFVDVHTLFFGKLREGTVDSWIIAVAIAGGILLLFLIVMGLMKMGFFKRGTKEELEALKEKAELEDNFSNDLG